MTDMRAAEVEALRQEVQRLTYQRNQLNVIVEDLMTPSGAANVLEAWLFDKIGTEYAALRVALRNVGEREGWK